jgi:hypothetical protein
VKEEVSWDKRFPAAMAMVCTVGLFIPGKYGYYFLQKKWHGRIHWPGEITKPENPCFKGSFTIGLLPWADG